MNKGKGTPVLEIFQASEPWLSFISKDMQITQIPDLDHQISGIWHKTFAKLRERVKLMYGLFAERQASKEIYSKNGDQENEVELI